MGKCIPGCRLSCEPLCGELKAEASDEGGKGLTSMLEWSLSKNVTKPVAWQHTAQEHARIPEG